MNMKVSPNPYVDLKLKELIMNAKNGVSIPEIHAKLGLVKLETAEKMREDAIKQIADAIYDKMVKNYGEASLAILKPGKEVKTYSEFGGVRTETFEIDRVTGKRYMSHYKRATTKGTYEIWLDPEGTYLQTSIELPDGRKKIRPLKDGKYIKSKTLDDWLHLEKSYYENRGSKINPSNPKDKISSSNFEVYNQYEDGSSEMVKFTPENKVKSRSVTLPNKDSIQYNYETGVTLFYNAGKNSKKAFYYPAAYHKNSNGKMSTAIVTKQQDEFGRDVRVLDMKFADDSGISADKFIYSLEQSNNNWLTTRGKLITGSFSMPNGNDNKITYKYETGRLFKNGEDITDNVRQEEQYKFYQTIEDIFVEKFKDALKSAGIDEEFYLAKYSNMWCNM